MTCWLEYYSNYKLSAWWASIVYWDKVNISEKEGGNPTQASNLMQQLDRRPSDFFEIIFSSPCILIHFHGTPFMATYTVFIICLHSFFGCDRPCQSYCCIFNIFKLHSNVSGLKRMWHVVPYACFKIFQTQI